jgi:phage terminase small subunit
MKHNPPEHLSPRSQSLWCDVVPSRCRSPERLALLVVALESLDRAEEAKAAVAVDGMTKVTPRSGAIHVHPLLRVERESRQMFSKIWGQLSLHWNQQIDGRYRPGEMAAAAVRDDDD